MRERSLPHAHERHHPGRLSHLLEKKVLLVIPVFNADGHERVSTFNRLNQNGPEGGMGFRANALGLDLNRDFIKLETIEAGAWVEGLFTRWWPHLTIDTHTTDGYDHRYALSSIINHPHPAMPVVLHETMTEMIEDISPRMREAGFPVQRYGSLMDKTRPERNGNSMFPSGSVRQARFTVPGRNRSLRALTTLVSRPFSIA